MWIFYYCEYQLVRYVNTNICTAYGQENHYRLEIQFYWSESLSESGLEADMVWYGI